ncbi:putative toxin-antitoxin system, toxin component [delta proteobacterium NaphS2]|nr:putative toxin-antitoxin system, toxin component [delta proteobacterium NaphS2]
MISKLKGKIHAVLRERPEILFGYLHGSVLLSQDPKDIDIAVFLVPDVYDKLRKMGNMSLDFTIPLEMTLEKEIAMPVDLQILNDAPLRFKYTAVSKGQLVIDLDSRIRSDFESITRVKYFDFRPKREAYLKEAFLL